MGTRVWRLQGLSDQPRPSLSVNGAWGWGRERENHNPTLYFMERKLNSWAWEAFHDIFGDSLESPAGLLSGCHNRSPRGSAAVSPLPCAAQDGRNFSTCGDTKAGGRCCVAQNCGQDAKPYPYCAYQMDLRTACQLISVFHLRFWGCKRASWPWAWEMFGSSCVHSHSVRWHSEGSKRLWPWKAVSFPQCIQIFLEAGFETSRILMMIRASIRVAKITAKSWVTRLGRKGQDLRWGEQVNQWV